MLQKLYLQIWETSTKESQFHHSGDIKLGINKIKNSVSKGNFSEVE